MDDLEDLEADIEVYKRLGQDLDYWTDLHTIAKAEIDEREKERRGVCLQEKSAVFELRY